ncbi:MAG: DNA internalization-related competence protein ComEC/Rec2 [Woeseiaceae bacterium]
MARTCLSLLAGMYAAQLSSFAVISEHLNAVFVASSILLFARQWRLAICFTGGALLFNAAAQPVIEARIPHDIAGDSIVVLVQVVDFPSRRGKSVSFLARPLSDTRLPDRIRLSWFDPAALPRLGDTWELEVRLRRPRGNRNPGGFDFEAWLFREHVAATGNVVNSWRNQFISEGQLNVTQRIRERFAQRVTALLGDTEQGSVLLAIVVGTRHLITDEQWKRYATTGSSHLMAISGLHIGLAAIGIYCVARLISGLLSRMLIGCLPNQNHHLFAIVCALAVACIYVQISGAAIPARRAGLMLLLASVYLVLWRRPDSRRIVCIVCLAIALADPLVTMSPGFALSFAAVGTLLWMSRRRNSGLPSIQLGLLFGLLPLTVIFFDRVSYAALPVNLIAVPLFSFVTVPLALTGMVLDGPLQTAGDVLLVIAGKSIWALEGLLRWVAESGWASRSIPHVTGVSWLLVCVPATWAILPPRWPGRSLAWIGLIGLTLHAPSWPQRDCARVTFLDVGQGLAVAVQTQRHVVLYDTGPAFRGGGSAAQNVVLPFLRSRGVQRIDLLVVSHADLDHAGGVADLTTAMPVDQVLAGEPLPATHSSPCRAGDRWSYDGIRFAVLHPSAETPLQGNDRSCVILLEVGAYRLLLTGDIEKAAEQSLLQDGRLPRVHVVSVPHHGSKTSSTAEFTRATSASVAIVSAAYGNHWGFPKEEVIRRWQRSGAAVLSTATAGAVELHVCADSGFTEITGYRVMKRRIWHE